MFGFGKKRESKERKAFREEFETTARQLKAAPSHVRVAVGTALNLANSMFAKTYGDADRFRSIPRDQQSQFISKLTAAENSFYEKQDPATALGFGLLKMWLGTVQENDAELEQQFGRDLAWLSTQGVPDTQTPPPQDAPDPSASAPVLHLRNDEFELEVPTVEWANALALALKFGWNPPGPSTAYLGNLVDVKADEAAALHAAWSAAMKSALTSPQTFYPVRMDMGQLAQMVELASEGPFSVRSIQSTPPRRSAA